MKRLHLLILTLLIAGLLGACGTKKAAFVEGGSAPGDAELTSKQPDGPDVEFIDETYQKREGIEVIYLAGGCFWGTEQLMQQIKGVVAATSGYSNGEEGVTPDYENISSTGFKETVRVEYEPESVSLDFILFAYFRSIDPTALDRQGNDVGGQYQAGIYWADDAAKETVLFIAEVEKDRYPEFAVELEPLRSFYDAEEYHQDYLIKNPYGYCHISPDLMKLAGNMVVDPADYRRPSDSEIKAALTEKQLAVTQEAATETPFDNEYWDNHEEGIYADVVTGEPLFSSRDKFDSGTGWPSFSKGIDENAFAFLPDSSYDAERTEVRSRAGNSHLGHVFFNEQGSPGGVRYCINSAALRFVPLREMDSLGYGYLKDYVN